MELRQLRCFLVVARTLNFTQAADELHIVQSAISQQIRRLEAELGVRLFERNSRRVALTEAGAVLRRRAEALLREAKDIEAEISEFAGLVKGRLRIGTVQSADTIVGLPTLLARFHAAHPKVKLSLRNDSSIVMATKVLEGTLDLAFVGMRVDETPPGLVHRREMGRAPLIAVVAPDHPLAGRGPAALADLAAAGPFLDYRPGTGLRALVDEAFAAAAVTRTTALEVDELDQLCRFAAAGLGAALVPPVAVNQVTEGPPPTTVSLVERIEHPLALVHRAPRPAAPAAQRFLLLLDEEVHRLRSGPTIEPGERPSNNSK